MAKPFTDLSAETPKSAFDASKGLGGRGKLFTKKSPGAPGKLGKSSTKAESLAKLRGKGALA